MLVIPAIDIKNRKCVRLLQGNPDNQTVYSEDPVAVARSFEEQGAELIHVVDLDGAFEGHPVNKDIVIKIAGSVSIPIEIGGGIRTVETAKEYVSAGINRIILGTAVIKEEFGSFIEKYSKYIIAGIDARDSKIATHGWKKISEIPAVDFIKNLPVLGINEIIYTDISTDGMLQGPNYKSIETVLDSVKGIKLIASGGVTSYKDIQELKKYTSAGLKGCIVGKAIYEKIIDLKEAIKIAQ